MLNRVMLIGNLGKNPEFRTTESGVLRAHIVLATNDSYKDRNGQIQKITDWHDMVVWRNLAEKARILKKGMLVYIEGKLTHRKWTDKDGNDHHGTEISVEILRILEKRDSYSHQNDRKSDHHHTSEENYENRLSESDEPGH